jgi:hypothetical protein
MPRFKTKLEEEEFHILDNSIERVINTTRRIVNASHHEDAEVNSDDWENLKWIVVRLWNEERNRIFERKMGK